MKRTIDVVRVSALAAALCACEAAASPRVTAPVAAQASANEPSRTPRPPTSACSTRTTPEQDLAAAHAQVRQALVAHKKDALEAANAMHVAHGEAASSGDELQRQLDSVDADEASERGAASDDATRLELPAGALAYFFHGAIVTDAGGDSDPNTWGILVVRDGCAWKQVPGDFGGSDLRIYRSPSGGPVLVQTQTTDQCGAQLRVLVFASALDAREVRIPVSRDDMEGVCPRTRRAVLDANDGVLTGVRVLSNQAADPSANEDWRAAASWVFQEGKLVER